MAKTSKGKDGAVRKGAKSRDVVSSVPTEVLLRALSAGKGSEPAPKQTSYREVVDWAVRVIVAAYRDEGAFGVRGVLPSILLTYALWREGALAQVKAQRHTKGGGK